MNRDEMLNKLFEGACTVVFTKTNGDERTMNCTLNMDMIPADNHPKTDGNMVKEANMSVIKAFDLDISAWRSFRVDSVKAFDLA